MKSYYFRSFDEKSHDAVCRGVTTLFRMLGADFYLQIGKEAEACVQHMTNVISSMNDYSIEHDWIPAAKRHKDRVAELAVLAFQISRSTGCSNPVISVSPNRIEFRDGFQIHQEDIVPRSFWRCYRLFSFLQHTKSAQELIAVLQLITCIFTIYKTLGITGPKRDERAKQHLAEQLSTKLKDEATTNHKEIIVHDFLQHIDNCIEGKETPRSKVAKEYLSSVKLAKKHFVRPQQTADELPLNTHSTGMSINGKGTMPGILASAFEGTLDKRDNSLFDALTGYTQSEKLCDLSNSTVRLTRTIFIDHRSKDDVREIHTASSYIQDRMNYHAKIMKHFLKHRRTICVWDQMKGVRDIVKAFNIEHIHAAYSLDLHAATDTLDREEQARVYSHLLRWLGYDEEEIEILVDHWLHYSSIELNVMMPHSHEYVKHRMATGQPMGFESSVYSLNLSHDLWATALADYCERIYALILIALDILGDDFFIAFKDDKDMIFPKLYQELMAELNTECNLSKGYIFNADIPEYNKPMAEFAKNLICDGVNITPLPLGALALCNTDQGLLSFLTWYKERMGIQCYDINFITSLMPGNEDILTLLCCCSVPNQFRTLAWGSKKLPDFRSIDYRVLLIVAIPFIKEFLMLDIMNELNQDPDYIPKITDYHSFPKEWRKYARMILNAKDRLPNNKFVALVDNLELIATAQSISMLDIAREIIPYADENDSILDLIPSLRKLSESNIQILLELFDLIRKLKDQSLLTEDYVVSESVINSISSYLEDLQLADFNPTAQRFGVTKEKITAGFDFDWIRKDAQTLMALFNISIEQVDDTLKYLSDITEMKMSYTWHTEYIDEDETSDPEEDYDDIWSLLIDL